MTKIKEIIIPIKCDTTELDRAIEKANQLKALLGECKQIIDSLSGSGLEKGETHQSGTISINIADGCSDNLIKEHNKLFEAICSSVVQR